MVSLFPPVRPCADPTRLEIRELERIASCLIKYSIADSTRRSYATGRLMLGWYAVLEGRGSVTYTVQCGGIGGFPSITSVKFTDGGVMGKRDSCDKTLNYIVRSD